MRVVGSGSLDPEAKGKSNKIYNLGVGLFVEACLLFIAKQGFKINPEKLIYYLY